MPADSRTDARSDSGRRLCLSALPVPTPSRADASPADDCACARADPRTDYGLICFYLWTSLLGGFLLPVF